MTYPHDIAGQIYLASDGMRDELLRRHIGLSVIPARVLVSTERYDTFLSKAFLRRTNKQIHVPSSPTAPRGNTTSPLTAKQLTLLIGTPTLCALVASFSSHLRSINNHKIRIQSQNEVGLGRTRRDDSRLRRPVRVKRDHARPGPLIRDGVRELLADTDERA